MMNISRLLLTVLSISFFSGCAVVKPPDFVFVTPEKKDTFSSLAKEHLGDPSLAWKIQESNDISTIKPGEEIIIPVKPIQPGGIKSDGYQLIPVLSYHNFSSGQNKDMLTVSQKNFENQLKYLKKEKYHTLTVEEFKNFLNLGHAPRNSILLTIDDGWFSSYSIAFPMLQKYRFNATLFITTDYLNEQNSKIISWTQASEMDKSNTINIQCHSKSHRDFNQLNDKESMQSYVTSLEEEVVTSKNIINKQIGKRISSFAYPYGNTNPVAIKILKKNDYETAFTVKRAMNTSFTPHFLLNRIMIFGNHDMNTFKKSVSVYKNLNINQSEPIDKIKDIRKIDYLNAVDYENKKQWRTALLAWKMQRDWLESHKIERIKNSLKSKEDLLKKANEKVNELNQQVKQIAQTHYFKATTSQGKKTIHKQLLRTLLYDPEHQAALKMLKEMSFKTQLTLYKVKESETFESISKKLYKKKNNDVLIPLFNSNIKGESDLKPGLQLILPTAAAMDTIKTSMASRCNVNLYKPSSQVAKDLYIEANELFNQDKISEAIDKLKKATCLTPGDEIAKEMLEMLQGL